MSSSITSGGKKLLLDQLKQDLDSSGSNYYIGLSGADSSGAGLFNQMKARNELHFLKQVSDNSFVIETYEWTSGTVYNACDADLPTLEKFYVVNSSNEVFLCIETAKSSTGVQQGSTIEPTSALAEAYDSLRRSFPTGDGYVWRYLYKMSGAAVNRFKTIEFMPVKNVVGIPTTAEEQEQQNLQNNATAGEILGIAIDSGGNDYEFTPRIDITGNGDSASFSATLHNGKIVAVTVDSDGLGKILHGRGYDYAKVTVSGERNALLRPILSPRGGVNQNPVTTLKSDKIMIQTTIQGNENGQIPLADPANDFKQVALIRNPLEYDSTGKYSGFAANAMDYLTVSAGSGTFVADELFVQTDGKATGKTYWHDTTNSYLYYVQNDSTGYGEFSSSQAVSSTQNTGTNKNIDALNDPTIDRYSGDIIYINNLDDAIARTSTQNEDFRIVIDLGND